MKDDEARAVAVGILTTSAAFYFPKHQRIYQACIDLYERSEPCDITTVANELQKTGQLEKCDGRVYLVELIEAVASTSNVETYAKIVLDNYLLRRLISTAGEISRTAYDKELATDDLLDKAEAAIFNIADNQARQGFVATKYLADASLKQIDRIQGGGTWDDSIPSGFDTLDELTQGLTKGNLIIIAGRPSMGKTALAMNIAENVTNTTQERRAVGIFSIEMSKEELSLRLLCSRAKVSQPKLRRGRLNNAEFNDLARAAQHFGSAWIMIDDSATLSPLQVRSAARRLKSQLPHLSLIVVDYIQLMHGTGKAENRQQEMTMISRALKTMAKEIQVPVIVVSQLSRAVETRGGDKRPQLADLRESGAIEQDADQVIFVYRPEYYLTEDERRDPKNRDKLGVAEIIVAKHRNGPTGTARLTFLREYARFENCEQYRQAEQPSKADQEVML